MLVRHVLLLDTIGTPSYTPAHTRLLEHMLPYNIALQVMVVALGLGSGSSLVLFLCSNLFISRINYYTRCKVSGLLRVIFISGCCIGFILLVVL
jgi:hypothetical protein